MATITGSKYNDTLHGTPNADTIRGLGGHDVLMASYGADIMDGGIGYDSVDYGFAYGGVGVNLATGHGYSDMAEGDTLVSIERLYGSVYNDFFIGNGEYNEFYGSYGNDYLDGGDYLDHLEGQGGEDWVKGGGGDDYLDGGADNDTLAGGEGNDTLIGSVGSDTASYLDATGIVWVNLETNQTSGAAGSDSFSSIENITGSYYDDNLTGDGGANIILGMDGGDRIQGGGGDDYLDGGLGRDGLIGGTGNDTMIGGLGDDYFEITEVGDVVIENAGEGWDGIATSMNYTLGANVESLSLMFGTRAISATGNDAGNSLIGNANDNILDGRAGIDLMVGSTGSDWYFTDNPQDGIWEFVGEGILDRLFTSVDYTLPGDMEIEIFSTTNSAGLTALNLTGNALGNTIFGNAGSNALKGLSGNDTLVGLGGADAFVFNTPLHPVNNVDRIVDFNVANDDVILGRGIFTALPTGTLPASQFRVGAGPADADDRIIYDSTTGALFYDADGIALAPAIKFATVSIGTALTNADFIVL